MPRKRKRSIIGAQNAAKRHQKQQDPPKTMAELMNRKRQESKRIQKEPPAPRGKKRGKYSKTNPAKRTQRYHRQMKRDKQVEKDKLRTSNSALKFRDHFKMRGQTARGVSSERGERTRGEIKGTERKTGKKGERETKERRGAEEKEKTQVQENDNGNLILFHDSFI